MAEWQFLFKKKYFDRNVRLLKKHSGAIKITCADVLLDFFIDVSFVALFTQICKLV
jgi:hypothetical protein